MAEQMTTDVRAILDRDPFDADAIRDLKEVLGRDPSRYKTLRDAASAMADREKGSMKPLTHTRLGVADVFLGRYSAALEHLEKAGDEGMAQFFKGIALENLQQWEAAANAFAAAAKSGYQSKQAVLHRIGALRRAEKVAEARKLFQSLDESATGTAEFHYQAGCFLVDDGELIAAAAEFEKAIAIEPDHSGALFHLAYINDLYGDDDKAIEYYRQCVRRPPVPLAALVNLGVLLEDEMRFREAETYYRQVLDHDPRHPRALLFMKDCRASRDMYYDEEAEKGYDKLRQLLEIPVTDFELSVRSRNCLRKMNIRTLGDLTRTTEAALLASKNFGETSLSEIKQMMTSKGVRLGMALESAENRHGPSGGGRSDGFEELSQEERAMMARPISDLQLSVRARKCMSKLGIATVGDLISHTGDQLLECKNFGVTSLNEVKDKLTSMGLKLKGD
jgi:DNA-directed RNA polymerase subunit alpha